MKETVIGKAVGIRRGVLRVFALVAALAAAKGEAAAMGEAAAKGEAAAVKRVAVPPVIDGKLDEEVWREAKWTGGFQLFNISRTGRIPPVKTEFAILADATNLYVAARAEQPYMDELKASPLRSVWCEEAVEFYFVPDGGVSEYYQFVMPFRGENTAVYWAEAGQIRPDPYGGQWQMKTAECEGGWTLEARLPLTAFYLTRQEQWRDTWRVNVARTSMNPHFSASCWADGENYRDLKKFPFVKGFPRRRNNEDVFIRSVKFESQGVRDGKIIGRLDLSVYTKITGWFVVETPFTEPKTVAIKGGEREYSLPAVFPENGRTNVLVRMTRTSDKSVIARTYPVTVDYRAVDVRFTSPGYRGNFYPGQCTDLVAGHVKAMAGGDLTLTLEGEGFPKREMIIKNGEGDFEFDTTGFKQGTDAMLTVTGRSGIAPYQVKVRNLAPLGEGRNMAWIENGRLIVDGKPVFRRNMYAEGYRGGKVFNAMYKADDLRQTREVRILGTFEPNRLLKGIEQKEATKDVKPSAELMAKIDAVIDRALKPGNKGVFYYISDEPECRNISAIYLRHIYRHVAERDPYHVILSCSRAGERYIDCADWFETHPYLNPHPDAQGRRVYTNKPPRLGSFVDAFHPEKHPDKLIGSTPTCFAYDWGDYPTFDEYMLNAWAHFVRGAKSCYPYAYTDLGDRAELYEGTRYLFSSIEALEDLLLDARRETLVKTEDYEATLWTAADGEKLFATVNFTAEKRRFTVKGLAGEFREFRGERRFTAAAEGYELELGPLETFVAGTRPRDASLPATAAVRERIAAWEKERTSRDNQLFARDLEIDVTGSLKVLHPRKLFDGVRYMHAWQDFGRNDDKFCALEFKTFKPRFDRVIVWGSGLESVVPSVPDENGGWRKLAVKSVERGNYSLALTLEEPVEASALRLGLGPANFELYEIELPKVKE